MRARLLDALATPPRDGDIEGHPNGRDVRVDLFRYPAIYRLLFSARLIATLHEISSEWPDDGHFVLYPGHSFHRNGFGNGVPDWHKDTDSQERDGWNFHWFPQQTSIHCATYLQDSTVEFGGGLSVIPGSHKIPNPYGLLQVPDMREAWYGDKTRVCIESKAGDLVCFDTRMDHYATHVSGSQPPPYGTKLALFFSIAPRDRFATLFGKFLQGCENYAYLSSYTVPPDMEQLARENNFSFLRLPV